MSARTQIERAELIQHVMEIRERTDKLLDLLLPDADEACAHPADAVEDRSTMDDDGQLFCCTKCGAQSKIPFPSISTED